MFTLSSFHFDFRRARAMKRPRWRKTHLARDVSESRIWKRRSTKTDAFLFSIERSDFTASWSSFSCPLAIPAQRAEDEVALHILCLKQQNLPIIFFWVVGGGLPFQTTSHSPHFSRLWTLGVVSVYQAGLLPSLNTERGMKSSSSSAGKKEGREILVSFQTGQVRS